MCVLNRSAIRITRGCAQGVRGGLVGAKLGSEAALTPSPVKPITMFASDPELTKSGQQKARRLTGPVACCRRCYFSTWASIAPQSAHSRVRSPSLSYSWVTT